MLPELVTFQFTPWPEPEGKIDFEKYENQTEKIAQEIFRARTEYTNTLGRPSKFRLLAMGAARGLPEGGVDFNDPLVYAQGQKIDPFGERSLVAARIDVRAAKFVEPCSDVFDYDLER